MTNASRAPIDFDAFERELRQTQPQSQTHAQIHAQPGAKSDPLAELARIVGQDDPFRALLEARGAGDRPAARIEPSFHPAPPVHAFATQASAQPGHAHSTDAAEPTAADAFDQYLASVEQEGYIDEPHDPAAFAEDAPGFRPAPVERPRMRGRLVQVGAGLGVLALCVTGALTWRGLHGHGTNGEPVTVLADRTPLKVAPTAADGVEIPDQNKQIYERKGKDGQTRDGQIKVVNREEQPLDVAQAARSAAPSAAAASGQSVSGQGGTTPSQAGLLSDSLGEPRRVRTVTVKPDTPPPPAQREANADPVGNGLPAPIPTMTMPDASTPTPPRRPSRTLASNPAATPTAQSAQAQSAQAQSAPATSAPAPVRTAEAPAAEAPIPAPAPAPRPRIKATQRVAAIAPETTASTVEATAVSPEPAPSAVASTAGGGFAVQLGVRTSESEARTALRQMQAKYAELAGKPELIRQAEVNGKSIYRVRVGPLAKAEATSLCSALQGAGGQCFVARN